MLKLPLPEGKRREAEETERAERACKVCFLPTASTPLFHVLTVYQELMTEILRWTKLHHANILPFYGTRVFQTVTLNILMVV